jgi:hypothetical protein
MVWNVRRVLIKCVTKDTNLESVFALQMAYLTQPRTWVGWPSTGRRAWRDLRPLRGNQLICDHERIARGGHGLSKVWPWPAMPRSTLLGPTGEAPLEWLFSSFRGGPPAGWAVSCGLLPLWTNHAVRLCLWPNCSGFHKVCDKPANVDQISAVDEKLAPRKVHCCLFRHFEITQWKSETQSFKSGGFFWCLFIVLFCWFASCLFIFFVDVIFENTVISWVVFSQSVITTDNSENGQSKITIFPSRSRPALNHA